MLTRWGTTLDAARILTEYPRPQMRRGSYLNLNGLWYYAITGMSATSPERYDGDILVPFSPESKLSGVGRTLGGNETLWYRRTFALPEGFMQARLLLHFGAVDQDAAVFCNGRLVAEHQGGYNAFQAELTDALAEGVNTLVVRVTDQTDAAGGTHGKQKRKRGGIWYTPQSGIWQTVWMESVPARYIQRLRLTPRLEDECVEIEVCSQHNCACEATVEGTRYAFTSNHPCRIPVRNPRLWSPDDPHLYPLTVAMGPDGVESYFSMRSTEIRRDAQGVKRLFLNGKPYFHNGLLDQGYWPDGLYTPPADEAMIFDIQAARAMGFNMLRKHAKVEPMRWYYHCDRLGMLVWQDMPNGGDNYGFRTIALPALTGRGHQDCDYAFFGRKAEAGRQAYRRELKEMVEQLYSCPSIVLWVPFNEGWGQFDAQAACALIDHADGTRPADPASGWHDQRCGEMVSHHVYYARYRFRADRRQRAVALSEFGGYNLRVKGHSWNDADFGYRRFKNARRLWEAYRRLYETQVLPAIPQGLCAAVYTQLTDVEDELNGLLTYDRAHCKLPEADVRALNQAVRKAGRPDG